MNKLGKFEKTARGFDNVEFKDANGADCSVQASSAIGDYEDSFDKPGSSYLWLGVNDADPKIMASDAKTLGIETKATHGWINYEIPSEVSLNTRMHLNREQVSGLVEELQYWLDNHKLLAE
jgi:hypothetical protein